MLEDDQMDGTNEEVTSETMRRLQFEKMDDDYYLGGGVGVEEVFDSDDEVSSDDEVKSHLRMLAGQEKKEMTKDAFGRKRRKSDFEDEMDDELDRSITEYASEHMGPKKEEKLEIENKEYDEECRKVDEQWKIENDSMERKMAALELLPYDVDLTDSEVDPEMPAAVLKDKNGEAIKLVYSCKRGDHFDVEERKKQQRERRIRLASTRKSEKERREEIMKSVAKSYAEIPKEGTSSGKKFIESEASSSSSHTPLTSILKKKAKKEEIKTEKEEKEQKGKEGENEEENPIKKALDERLKEIEKNDELLYDDEEDDANEKWVNDRRKEQRGGEEARNGEVDGVLSCPGCMNELTRDCQRHEIYKTQYRAMFVSNCRLDEQKMTVEKTGKEKRRERQRAKKQHGNVPSEISDEDLFTPVKCATCGTLVAMMDHDEVYHFFNVLAGYS